MWNKLKWKLSYYGITRRYLIATRPWRDWIELRPIKRRLGITVPGPKNDLWKPSRVTCAFWIGALIGVAATVAIRG